VAAFSVRTFEEELPARSLEHVRRVAQFQNAAFLDAREGVRFEGFAFWIALFAEKQEEEVRVERNHYAPRHHYAFCLFILSFKIPWTVLYEWGYDHRLQLDEDTFLYPSQVRKEKAKTISLFSPMFFRKGVQLGGRHCARGASAGHV
jgi:hypothetical protein